MDELIQRAQRLDADALEQLVDLYAKRLHAFLQRHTGNRDDAQELVQEVFVRVVSRIQQYQHDGRFEAWLFRIAMNLARDRARRKMRSPEVSSIDTPLVESADKEAGWESIESRSGVQADAASILDEDIDRMQHALTRLPEHEREVILLRHYGHMSYADIAELMETPLGTALARAHRGLGKLRQWMEEKS